MDGVLADPVMLAFCVFIVAAMGLERGVRHSRMELSDGVGPDGRIHRRSEFLDVRVRTSGLHIGEELLRVEEFARRADLAREAGADVAAILIERGSDGGDVALAIDALRVAGFGYLLTGVYPAEK